jgi:hypothetical protein
MVLTRVFLSNNLQHWLIHNGKSPEVNIGSSIGGDYGLPKFDNPVILTQCGWACFMCQKRSCRCTLWARERRRNTPCLTLIPFFLNTYRISHKYHMFWSIQCKWVAGHTLSDCNTNDCHENNHCFPFLRLCLTVRAKLASKLKVLWWKSS